MKLVLKNFGCHVDNEFDFGSNGMALLSGMSGTGKSTIVRSIYFALYGLGNKVQTYGKTSCKVELIIEDMKIVRTKRPNRVVVNDVYEDKAAQNIINKKFGEAFDVTGYIAQNARNSFILMSPIEKLAFLESFAFREIELGKIKGRCKALIKKKHDEHLSTLSNLEMAQNMLDEIKKPEHVKFPIPSKNKEKSKRNTEIKSKNCTTLINKNRKRIESLEKELSDCKVLENSTRLHNTSLIHIQTKLTSLESELEELEYIGDDELDEEKDKLAKTLKNKEFTRLKEKYEEDKQRLEENRKREDEKRDKEINEIEHELWQEYNKDELSETRDDLEDCLKAMKKYARYIKEQKEFIYSENKINKDKEKLISLEKDLDKKKDLLTILKLQEKVYSCPKCKSKLKLNDEELILEENENEIEESIDDVKDSITVLKKEVSKKRREVELQERHKERWEELEEKIQELNEQYEDLDPELIDDTEKDIQYLYEYEKENKRQEKRLNELKNKPYSDTFLNMERQNKKNKKQIDEYDIEDIEVENEEELRETIHTQEKIRDKIESLSDQIEELEKEEKGSKDKIETDNQTYIDKYKKIRKVSIIEKTTDKCRKDIEKLESEREGYIQILEEMEKYFNYEKEIEQYNTWKDKVTELDKKERTDRKKYSSAMVLKEKILLAESIAIGNVIDSINTHSQLYLDHFFPTDPISVRLLSFKEVKNKSNKPQINLEIEYKGMECDFNMLSGGEQSRIILSFTLALGEMFNTPLFLLDECTSSLDQELTGTVIEGLRNNFENKLVLIIAHQVVEGVFDRVIKLK